MLLAAAEHTAIPTVGRSPRNSKFLVSAFVNSIQTTDPEAFKYLDTVVKGNMLANALFLPDIHQTNKRFRNTSVYVDSPLLIFAAGYAGKPRQTPCEEMLELLYVCGANTVCLQRSVDEARGVLDACAARMRRGELRDAYGPSIEYFLSEGFTSSDVDLFSARLPRRLGSLRITVKESPPYVKKYQIDELVLEKHLQDAVGYRNPDALRHDVDAISAIARLRRGRAVYSVEDCRSLFVTSNVKLARATREFFQADAPHGAVSLCLTDFQLTNFLWLKNPMAAPDLPRNRIIADAYAAMQPSDGLWTKYLTEIAKLEEQGDVTIEDYVLLRHSHEAKTALMDLTLGDEHAFVEGTVPEILNLAQRRLRADLKVEIAEHKDRQARAEQEIQTMAARNEGRRDKLRAVAGRVAAYTAQALLWLVILLTGLGTLYAFPWPLPVVGGAVGRYAGSLVLGLVFVITVMNLVFGRPAVAYIRRFEVWLFHQLERRLVSWLEL